MMIRCEPYDGPVARTLVARLQSEYVARYGGTDLTPTRSGEFVPPYGGFLVGYLDDAPVACGGFRIRDGGEAEIKRMYVDPGVRGRGLSRELLAALEAAVQRAGCDRAILETGTAQPEAIGLYESSGYARIPDFGVHIGTPELRCYGKQLRE